MKSALDKIDLKHHAYAVIGGEDARAAILAILEREHGISAQGNPDFFDRKYHSFAIDDAREVKLIAETKPFTEGGRKIFIIAANGVTVEAQNALLKLLEEPPAHAHFFLVIPSSHLLLPTMKSRVSVIGEAHVEYDIALAEEFLKVPPTKRMDHIKSFMDEIAKEKRPKQDAVELIKGLEVMLAQKGKGSAHLRQNKAALEAVMLAEKYSTDRAPSLKMLLEYVAMNL